MVLWIDIFGVVLSEYVYDFLFDRLRILDEVGQVFVEYNIYLFMVVLLDDFFGIDGKFFEIVNDMDLRFFDELDEEDVVLFYNFKCDLKEVVIGSLEMILEVL